MEPNQTFAKLTMIDLAGSERISSHTSAQKISLQKEGSAINKSLLALGNCISGMVRMQQQQTF
jgi:hypothetical protein